MILEHFLNNFRASWSKNETAVLLNPKFYPDNVFNV